MAAVSSSFGADSVSITAATASGFSASMTQAITLAAGQYAVELIGSANADGSYDGTFGNFSIVPSPGAMAIVGLAGLVGRRRRG